MPRDLRRTGMLLLLLAAPAVAQFAELATTDDGRQLYFTSRMLLKGREPGPWPESRLYRVGPGAVTLFAERGALAPRDTGSSSDGVSRVTVSGDGSLVAYTLNRVCASASACDKVVNRIEIPGKVSLAVQMGYVQVSPNGRYALVTDERSESGGEMVVQITKESTLFDLSTGQRTPVPFTTMAFMNASLTSAGAVLVMRPTDRTGIGGVAVPEYGIWKQGIFAPLPIPIGSSLVPAAISDNGSVIVAYDVRLENDWRVTRLVAISAAGRVTTIADVRDPAQISTVNSIANDGRQVLYTLGNSAFVHDTDAGTSVAVPLKNGEAATDGVLSGDGKFAFVATTHARIVRFDLATKALSDVFTPVPQCDDPGPLAGGSFARLKCNFTTPLSDLEGKIALDGTPVPILYSTAGELGVQIPWKPAFLPPSVLTFNVAAGAPFEPSQQVRVYDGAPAIVPSESGLFGMKILKGDWSGSVTEIPAPGEIFHIYMTGLGWTAAPETTGVPASATQPNPIQWDLTCAWLPDLQPTDRLFAARARNARHLPDDVPDAPRMGGGQTRNGPRMLPPLPCNGRGVRAGNPRPRYLRPRIRLDLADCAAAAALSDRSPARQPPVQALS